MVCGSNTSMQARSGLTEILVAGRSAILLQFATALHLLFSSQVLDEGGKEHEGKSEGDGDGDLNDGEEQKPQPAPNDAETARKVLN